MAGSTDGRVALVLGGAGEVGGGITRAFLTEGWLVIVPSRSENRLTALRAYLGKSLTDRLETVVWDVSDPRMAQQLAEQLQSRYGGLNAVVASMGGWWQGAKIYEAPMADWQQVYTNNLLSHFIALTGFYSVLKAGTESCYLFINGSAAQEPVPMSGLASIFAAAQLMMKDVLAAEEPTGPRANTLMINTPVRSRSRQHPNEAFLTADEIGAVAEYVCSPRGLAYRGETIQLSSHEEVQMVLRTAVRYSGIPDAGNKE